MSDFCRCCTTNRAWVESHIDPEGIWPKWIADGVLEAKDAREEAEAVRGGFHDKMTDAEVDAIEAHILGLCAAQED